MPDKNALAGKLLLVLALVVPALAGYAAYHQWQLPTMDFLLVRQNPSVVHHVVPGGYAEQAGLEPGDMILTVDDIPFALWYQPQIGQTHLLKIERRGEQLSVAVPATRVFRLNYPFLLSAIIVSLAFWAMGTLLFLRRFKHFETRLLFLLSQAVALTILFPLAYHAPWQPPHGAMAVSVAAFNLTAPLLLHYALSFPVRLGNARQRRAVLVWAYASAVLAFGLWLIKPRLGTPVSILFFSLTVAAAIAVILYVYLYRANPDERRRTRVIIFGTLVAALPPVLLYLLPSALRSRHLIPEWLIALFLLAAPASYLYATLRYNLFGIDRLLNRTLVYVLMALGVFVVYLTPYLFLYRYAADNLFAQLTFIFVLALWVGWTFDWMRQRTQRFVDNLFYGGWYDYPAVVETVSNALARSSTRAEVTEVLTRQLPDLMRLKGAALIIGADRAALPEANTPQSPPRFHFDFQSDVPARWTVGAHRDGDDLSEADQRILRTVAQQAEIALNNALMIETLRQQLEEIRASREALAQMQHRLLLSREEERSRLARDLHDGPIQSLIGLNIQLGLLLNTEPLNETVAAAFTDMRSEIRELSAELRQVCTELRPPMLDTLGLGAAIRSLVETWAEQSGVEVRLSLPAQADFRTLPEEVALNFYRVAQETLTNIGKHAQATRVDFALTYENNRLTMTIQDNGRGFDAPLTTRELTAQKHFGLAGMKERMEQIGGQWHLTSAPGRGTTVQAVWVPHEAQHA